MEFKIDLKIFIFLIIFYFTKQIEIFSIIIFFSIIHELGHLLFGILLGMKPQKMKLMPVGLSISFKLDTKNYNKKIKKGNLLELKKIIVALAGPLTNFIIIILVNFININFIDGLVIIYTNILIIIFNLIPIYPLDGGRILKGILYINFGKKISEELINKISIITICILTIISSILILYLKNINIILILSYLWFLVLNENSKFIRRKEIYLKIEESKKTH